MVKELVLLEYKKLRRLEDSGKLFIFCMYKRSDIKRVKEILSNYGLSSFLLSKRGLLHAGRASGSNLVVIYNIKCVSVLNSLEQDGFSILYLQEKNRVLNYLQFKNLNYNNLVFMTLFCNLVKLNSIIILNLYCILLKIVVLLKIRLQI